MTGNLSRTICWRAVVLAAGLLLTDFTDGRAQQPELANSVTSDVEFASHDGLPMLGRLTLPLDRGNCPVVVYVQTAEGATIDMKRPGPRGAFNYFDLYRRQLPGLKVGFFSYEGRGVRMGGAPPRFEEIDAEVYNTSTLENKVRDVLAAVKTVRKQPGVDAARIYLMGASEGTLLAAEAASRAPDEIHGLILYAVVSTTLKDALHYMAADGNFLALRGYFDDDQDGTISLQEFEADSKKMRARAMQGVAFDQFDANRDGVFTLDEMRAMRKPVLDGIDQEDFAIIDAYLKATAAVSIPDGWVQDHFRHANMWTFLSTLTMPVGFFHGSSDNLTPIAGVRSLEDQAKSAGKTNFEFHYFEGLDHSLGIGAYFVTRELPAGHQAIFKYIEDLTRGDSDSPASETGRSPGGH